MAGPFPPPPPLNGPAIKKITFFCSFPNYAMAQCIILLSSPINPELYSADQTNIFSIKVNYFCYQCRRTFPFYIFWKTKKNALFKNIVSVRRPKSESGRSQQFIFFMDREHTITFFQNMHTQTKSSRVIRDLICSKRRILSATFFFVYSNLNISRTMGLSLHVLIPK